MYCEQCGARNAGDARFCEACGVAMGQTAVPLRRKPWFLRHWVLLAGILLLVSVALWGLLWHWGNPLSPSAWVPHGTLATPYRALFSGLMTPPIPAGVDASQAWPGLIAEAIHWTVDARRRLLRGEESQR